MHSAEDVVILSGSQMVLLAQANLQSAPADETEVMMTRLKLLVSVSLTKYFLRSETIVLEEENKMDVEVEDSSRKRALHEISNPSHQKTPAHFEIEIPVNVESEDKNEFAVQDLGNKFVSSTSVINEPGSNPSLVVGNEAVVVNDDNVENNYAPCGNDHVLIENNHADVTAMITAGVEVLKSHISTEVENIEHRIVDQLNMEGFEQRIDAQIENVAALITAHVDNNLNDRLDKLKSEVSGMLSSAVTNMKDLSRDNRDAELIAFKFTGLSSSVCFPVDALSGRVITGISNSTGVKRSDVEKAVSKVKPLYRFPRGAAKSGQGTSVKAEGPIEVLVELASEEEFKKLFPAVSKIDYSISPWSLVAFDPNYPVKALPMKGWVRRAHATDETLPQAVIDHFS
jgi:hypothetical protein